MHRILVPVVLVATALACSRDASVSESQCVAGDWETIGYRDGALGYRSSRLLAHQDACLPHGVTPDREAYQLGWRQGIEEFCDPTNGFELGQSGDGHDNVCPAQQRDVFLAAYDRGRTLFVARDRVLSLAQAIGEEVVVTASAQLNPLLLPDERIQRAARVKRLYDEKTRLAAESPGREAELQVRTSELEALDRSMASGAF